MLPLLTQYLAGGKDTVGGQLMLGFVSAVAVATILAVVAGLTLAFTLISSGRAKVEEHQQVLVARITAVLVGIVATLLSILAEGVNVTVSS